MTNDWTRSRDADAPACAACSMVVTPSPLTVEGSAVAAPIAVAAAIAIAAAIASEPAVTDTSRRSLAVMPVLHRAEGSERRHDRVVGRQDETHNGATAGPVAEFDAATVTAHRVSHQAEAVTAPVCHHARAPPDTYVQNRVSLTGAETGPRVGDDDRRLTARLRDSDVDATPARRVLDRIVHDVGYRVLDQGRVGAHLRDRAGFAQLHGDPAPRRERTVPLD